jgi:hypothetical protein
MDKIYVGQSKLRITINTGADLTGASLLQIQYKKASGDITNLTGVCDDLETGIVYWDSTPDSIFTSAGNYWFWVKVTYPDGKVMFSESIIIKVYNVGE